MMHNTIPSLPCGKILYVRYEDFTVNPMKYADDLAAILSVEPSVMQLCMHRVVQPHHKEVPKEREHVHEFFQHVDNELWPLLTGEIPFPRLNITRPRLPPRRTYKIIPGRKDD